MAASEEELLNSSSRFLYFNQWLKMFQIFYYEKYILECWYIMNNACSLYMNQLAGEETIFDNLSKIIQLKFISTTWPQ